MPIPVEILECYKTTGIHREGRPFHLRPSLPGLKDLPSYGLAIWWPASVPFLTIEGRVTSPGKSTALSTGPSALAEVGREVGLFLPQESGGRPTAVAVARKDATIRLEFVIDTEDARFQGVEKNEAYRPGATPDQAAEVLFDPATKRLTILVHVKYFAPGPNGQPYTEDDQIRLTLSQVQKPGLFNGYVALDLGNTNSTLACLNRPDHGRGLIDKIKMLVVTRSKGRAQLNARAQPIRSSIRIDRVQLNRYAERSEHPKIFSWVIDEAAEQDAGGHGELIVGPKRLLAGRNWQEPRTFPVLGSVRPDAQAKLEAFSAPRRLPAELFICRILERFREATGREPTRLAITYPTTYTRRELSQLCHVVQLAWHRLRYESQANVATDVERRLKRIDDGAVSERDEGICLLLDEATAAAFFFLYRKIFESDGGLPRFRYVHPHGPNLLLYDCGGGTTDIALVRAFVHPDRPQELTVRVLDRSGLRDFGGDNITEAVFRILKAQLALAVAGRDPSVETPPAFPPKPQAAALNDYLTRNDDAFDAAVPTQFGSKRPEADIDRNKPRTMALWGWAESIKADLSRRDGEDPRLAKDWAPLSLRQLVGELIGVTYAGDEVLEFIDQQGRQIQRWMVDALVRPAIEKSIKKCNKLIAKPRPSAPPPLAEPGAGAGAEDEDEAEAVPIPAEDDPELEEGVLDVHWVVAAGNASRYPLVMELLRERLDVSFKGDAHRKFEPLDGENLKHAVAKGAVLAFKAMNEAQNIHVRFPDNLTNRLPYRLGFKDDHWAHHAPLFRENAPYVRMREKVFEAVPKVDEAGRAHPPSTIHIDRRWPGDDAYEGHLQFDFAGGIKGPVALRFNAARQDFELVEQGSNRVVQPSETDEGQLYVPPMQRGDL